MTARELLIAICLDVLIGDPQWLPHPVRMIGRAITSYEQWVRRVHHSPRRLLGAGVGLALILPGLTYGVATLVIHQTQSVSVHFGHVTSILLACTTLAGRDLWDHAMRVRVHLCNGTHESARNALAKIVARDTDQLEESEIVRGTVETIAESLCDGVIAPLLYLAVGGAPLALAYKAINTLDSMVGRQDERYEHLGWASARLDDVANWIPARITGALIVVAAGIRTGCWQSAWNSWVVYQRYGHRHPSPNSGRPEAAMAGALGVRLGGINYYDGEPEARPVIGHDARALTASDIDHALMILVISYGLGAFLSILIAFLSRG